MPIDDMLPVLTISDRDHALLEGPKTFVGLRELFIRLYMNT